MSESVPTEFEKANREIKLMEVSVRTETEGSVDKMTVGALMMEFRYFLDLRERIEVIDKRLGKGIENIKKELIAQSYEQDTKAFASDDLSVTIKDAEKIKITGDWAEIQRTLLDAGYGTSVQRRISEKHILEGFYAGDLRLPDGIDLYSYRTTNQRRK